MNFYLSADLQLFSSPVGCGLSGLFRMFDSHLPATFAAVEIDAVNQPGESDCCVLVLREAAGRLEVAQRVPLSQKAKKLSTSFASIPNGLLIALIELDTVFELQHDLHLPPQHPPFLFIPISHGMPAPVRQISSLSDAPVGPSTHIGISLGDKTLRLFGWSAGPSRLTQLSVVAGPQNWDPLYILPIPHRMAFIVSNIKETANGKWADDIELFCASGGGTAGPTPADRPELSVYQHRRTLIDHAVGCDIRVGWTFIKSATSWRQLVLFDSNNSMLKLFNFI